MKKIHPHYILIPVLIALCIISLVMRKYGVVFASFFTIVSFDAAAVYFLSRVFTRQGGVKFNFHHLVFMVSAIAILYHLQDWNGWRVLTNVAFILNLLFLLFLIFSIKPFLYEYDKETKQKFFIGIYLPGIFLLIMITISFFFNPRQFHSLFNARTYEEHVRQNHSMEEATRLLDLYKPADLKSAVKSVMFHADAARAEAKEEYDEALELYNKSIDLNPDYAEAIENRGFLKLTHLELSREMAADAIADFTRAIELKPDLAAAYYHRAMANEFLRPRERSLMVNDLQKAIDLDSSYKSDKFVVRYFK